MKLVVISDTHNQHWNVSLPKGDILIHCGDFSGKGELEAYNSLNTYLNQQFENFKHVITIPGNHDVTFESNEALARSCFNQRINILINQSITVEGINFYGSPVTPRFFDWAFNVDRGTKIKQHWDCIPDNTDVLITHGPPFGILDQNGYGTPCGCLDLLNRIRELPNLKLHLFGHIHEGYGQTRAEGFNTYFINASTCTGAYRPKNKPVVIDLCIP